MMRDHKICIMGEEVGEYQGAYKVIQGIFDMFGPTRVIDTQISEHDFTGFVIGATFTNLRLIVELMTFNFAMQVMGQIVNSAAKTNYMLGDQTEQLVE